VQLYHHNLKLKNLTTTVFNPKRAYERYLIRDVDYLGEFILQLKSTLEQYGLSLVRFPIDAETPRNDRVIYKITEYQVQETPKSNYGPLMDIVRHKTTIDFEGSFLNQVVFEDFRTQYQDVRFLTDFTTFDAIDKIGRHWKASLKWNPISTDWNPDFNQDSQGNSGIPCTFQVELRYYVVYDHAYDDIISTINTTLTADEINMTRRKIIGPHSMTENTVDSSPAPEKPADDIDHVFEPEPDEVIDIHEQSSDDLDEWLKMRTNE
jgi:hypothetical protein